MKILRNLFLLLLLLAVGVALYLYFLSPQRAPAPRLAPPGTVYLLRYFSAPRPGGGGLIGFAPGTALRVVGNHGASLVVSDGAYQAEVPRSLTTDDLDAAEGAARSDTDLQRRAAAERARIERDEALIRQRQDVEQRREQAELEQRRLHPTPAPTPTPARR